jgi:hypothetical protein
VAAYLGLRRRPSSGADLVGSEDLASLLPFFPGGAPARS